DCEPPANGWPLQGGRVRTEWHAQPGAGSIGQLIAVAAAKLGDRTDALLLIRSEDGYPGKRAVDTLTSAFSPADGREICCIAHRDGRREFPVLLGRRYFETLADAGVGQGMSELVANAAESVVDIETQ
ncbi:MAG: hypothetical protein OXB95_01425, partial [Rhodobacteraceae bacterium]|nr:hypothetical protein [Paracoccaceae bacterium]